MAADTKDHTLELNASDFEVIQKLEESLWSSSTRFDKELMELVFARDFFEFGRSGRTYTRDQMLFDPSDKQQIGATIPLPEFQARLISRDVVQTTYLSEIRKGKLKELGKRSSIWSKLDGRWKLRFHQGTPFQRD